MEPGHEDREYPPRPLTPPPAHSLASMEPGHEDREYPYPSRSSARKAAASMEPGHEDREYGRHGCPVVLTRGPQWSPAMKTGNTLLVGHLPRVARQASMEPGHEDREYPSP